MFTNKKIHLIGIGGISMSSIALMLKNMNSTISGSDINNTDITKNLEDHGIVVKYGHHPEMIKDVDIVVYTAAIKKDDPELVEARRLNKITYERAEILGEMMKEFKHSLCVSGTHGKSTTTAMLAKVFLTGNLFPTIQVGAILKEINGNTYIGGHDYLILEACEYVDSFLNFHPTSAIITNIDNDHLDYFKNLDNIKKSFQKYVSLLPEEGYLVKNNDDINSNSLDKFTKATIITYGINNESLYMAKDITANDLGHYSFKVYKENSYVIDISLGVNGYHNIYNALAVFALANQYIDDVNIIKEGLESYHGVGRRFEYLGKYNKAYIYDDYAHHPSELKTTLASSKEIKHNESWAIFQSHTYSRTKEHLEEFAEVLKNFDHVIIAPIYAAREVNTFNVNEEMLVKAINKEKKIATYIDSFAKIVTFLKENIQPNDLVITIGAGPINQVAEKLISKA